MSGHVAHGENQQFSAFRVMGDVVGREACAGVPRVVGLWHFFSGNGVSAVTEHGVECGESFASVAGEASGASRDAGGGQTAQG